MENFYVLPPIAQMRMLCEASEGHFYTDALFEGSKWGLLPSV